VEKVYTLAQQWKMNYFKIENSESLLRTVINQKLRHNQQMNRVSAWTCNATRIAIELNHLNHYSH